MGYGIFNNWHKSKNQSNTTQTEKLDTLAKDTKDEEEEEIKNETDKIKTSLSENLLTKKLEYYKNKLLNLNSDNPSIFLEEIDEDKFFDLGEKILLGEKYAKKIIDNAIKSKKPVCIVPDTDLSKKAIEDREKIKTIYKKLIQIERDRGIHDAYLGFPFITGFIDQDTLIRAPLVLFPVFIEHIQDTKIPGWYISFSIDKPPFLNKALFTTLEKDLQFVFSESFINEFENMLEETESGKELFSDNVLIKNNIKNNEILFLKNLQHLLHGFNFPLTGNIENVDKTEVIVPASKLSTSISSSEEYYKETYPKFNLQNSKVIGYFPQGNSSIYYDYDELIKKAKIGEKNFGIIDELLDSRSENNNNNSIINNSDNTKTGTFDDIELDKIPAKTLNFTIESDTSQDKVAVFADKSECIVVRGPPGTGKSQLIVNLVSNAMSKNKKVLVVCQKRTALDVVYQRINKIGLAKYVALLHDAHNDRPELYQHIGKMIESHKSTKNVFNNINDRLDYCSKQIDEIILFNNNLITSLMKNYFGGICVHDLYFLAKPGYVSKIDLSAILFELEYPKLSSIISTIKSVEEGCRKFDSPEYPWRFRNDFSNLSFNERNVITKSLEKLISILSNGDSVIIKDNIEDQRALVENLYILTKETGIFRRLKSDWQNAITNTKRLLNQKHLSEDQSVISELKSKSSLGLSVWEEIQILYGFLTNNGMSNFSNLLNNSDDLKSFTLVLQKMKDSIQDFDELQSHDARKSMLGESERKILSICSNVLSNTCDWGEIVEQDIFLHWIDFIESQNPILRGKPFELYNENRERLSKLIDEHRMLVIKQISSTIDEKIYKSNSKIQKSNAKSTSTNSEKSDIIKWNKLIHELNKKRRLLPVKNLIEIYGSEIFPIVPCWLMSPESVSSVFPLQRSLFDYIIFDEASQIEVDRSLPSIYRGEHIIILGDEKQLSPSDWFKIKDDDDEELVDESMLSESLLVLARRIYGNAYLKWHYRSKHQELVNFSNHAFYDGNLEVAPNIVRNISDTPIKWIKCEQGVWDDRKNIPEAIMVVKQIKEILLENERSKTNRSIGVITFNINQRKEIERQVDLKMDKDSRFNKLYSKAANAKINKLEDIPIIRNIENVQGDERDIIIFSTGYAKSEEDNKSITVRFGSINQAGGENRLNVSITRARQKIIIISSFEPSDMDTSESRLEGPKKLKKYLQYAKSINDGDISQVNNILSSLNKEFSESERLLDYNDIDFKFERSIQEKLQEKGYEVDFHIGHSEYKVNLAVVHPDDPSKYILAIETDGKIFLSAQSSRERDVTRQQFLENKGWIIERIWSRNWWRDSEKEIDRLKQRIESLRKTQ
jgi:superfamily I DNA and/or RNA helicase